MATFALGPFFEHSGDAQSIYQNYEKVAIRAESLGFDAFLPADHLEWPKAYPPLMVIDPFSLTGALSKATKRIRLGIFVACNTFRHPSILAKMSSSLDIISGGRFILGIGAGYIESEHISHGIPYPKDLERLKMMEEAVRVIKAIWSNDRLTFTGKYYTVREMDCSPRPVQKPHPPILIGGSGEKFSLRIAVEYGDFCNFRLADYDPLVLKRKLEAVKNHCLRLGRPYDRIRKSLNLFLLPVKDRLTAMDKLQGLKQLMSEENLARSGLRILPVEDCLQLVQGFMDLGIDYFVVNILDALDGKGPELFKDHVMSALD